MYVDVIIPRGGENHVAIDLIVQHIRTKLGQQNLCKIYPNLNVILSTFQIRGMHTLIRDKEIAKHDFVFYSDRLIRLVVEHGLGYLPFTEKQVITPTWHTRDELQQVLSILSAAMLNSAVNHLEYLVILFQDQCTLELISARNYVVYPLFEVERAWRTHYVHAVKELKLEKSSSTAQLIYEKLPKDISQRHVLLLDPVLATGNSAIQAIGLLVRKGVPESQIIFLNLISAPEGIHRVYKQFPSLKIVTSEIDVALNDEFHVVPGMGDFGDRYFGTDDV
ncbi:uridine kinase-like protein 3 [Juglans microcarpa x Juglans regia]|uniref:uridine kinase-like protein 3 n=1 Tax=Juglans microcarpa x Juglans regia TaxID=2249226 RepID=UPI001B7E270B|nr:uridine kinase-like protein 3 [Juglans microcarpa x Juglans regia]